MPGLPLHPLFPSRLTPDLAHVEVVGFEIGPPVGPLAEATLAPEERARAARFVFDRDRTRFVNARAGLRAVLGICLGVEPASVGLSYEPRGKPILEVAHPPLRFNLSHSGDRALVAVALGREVGIDIELIRWIDHAGLARAFFSPGERAALERGSENERHAAFYRCWVAKESYLKARGDGLTSSLDAFEVDVTTRSGGLRWSTLEEQPHRWRIEQLDLGDGYAGAVTSEVGDWFVRHWEGGVEQMLRNGNAFPSASRC